MTRHAPGDDGDLQAVIGKLNAKVTYVQWQLVMVLGGVAALIIKAFF
jgi:hypothetical protein